MIKYVLYQTQTQDHTQPRPEFYCYVQSLVSGARFLLPNAQMVFIWLLFVIYLCTSFVNTGTNEHSGNAHKADMILYLEVHGMTFLVLRYTKPNKKSGLIFKKQKAKAKKQLNTDCQLFYMFREVNGIRIEQSTPQDPK